MSQSQGNFWTEGQKNRRADPNSQDPSGHSRGSKKAIYRNLNIFLLKNLSYHLQSYPNELYLQYLRQSSQTIAQLDRQFYKKLQKNLCKQVITMQRNQNHVHLRSFFMLMLRIPLRSELVTKVGNITNNIKVFKMQPLY